MRFGAFYGAFCVVFHVAINQTKIRHLHDMVLLYGPCTKQVSRVTQCTVVSSYWHTEKADSDISVAVCGSAIYSRVSNKVSAVRCT